MGATAAAPAAAHPSTPGATAAYSVTQVGLAAAALEGRRQGSSDWLSAARSRAVGNATIRLGLA
jgi:hypothetical protein